MKRIVWFIVLLLVVDSATRAGAGVISQIKSPACHIADVKVEGATEFTTNRVVELSRLKSGQIAGELPIARATERVRRAYANRGRIKANVSIESDIKSPPDREQRAVDIRIRIDEGALFRLRMLEFIGNHTTRDRIVRRCFIQQEGEPYRLDLMERSLIRLNGLKRFKRITMSSIESHVDDQEHIVDVLVHLKETRHTGTRR